MKRIITALLFTALLISSISCASEQTTAETTVAARTVETTAPEEDDYGYVDPELPEKDYDGRAFNILYPEWSLYNNYYFAEEDNGEVVNDALYDRARRVEEYFNIDFSYITLGYIETIYPAVQRVVAAGMSEYDLVLTHNSTSLTGYVTEGIVANWNSVPSIDLDKPYWNQSVRESFEVNGILPFMSSDYILPDVNSIFFNKGLIEQYSLENPYELVESGVWTWDKLRELASGSAADLNGDSIMDDQDQYGFVAELGWQFASVFTACGQDYFGKDDDGLPAIACDNDKTQDILEKITQLLYRDDCSYTWNHSAEYDPNQGGTPPVSFDNGRALFYLTPLSLATTFRETLVDYGILPLPKYDENQSDYSTLNWAGFMCIPTTVSDLECVGLVSEMLAAESCRTVMPAFYDVLLGEKIALDPDAKEMLDILFDNTIYDLGVNLGYYSLCSSQISNDSPNNTSYLASNRAAIEKTINDYIEGCEGYN